MNELRMKIDVGSESCTSLRVTCMATAFRSRIEQKSIIRWRHNSYNNSRKVYRILRSIKRAPQFSQNIFPYVEACAVIITKSRRPRD
jgi:hypothetical protein